MKRKATAIWEGNLKDGKGSLTADSGVFMQTPYSFGTRFENSPGTNPEELLAAAHAGCFAMALSGELNKVGLTPKKLEVTATISIEQTPPGFSITKSQLDLTAEIPGADKEKFDAAAKAAKEGCPVSKLFKAEISLSANLKN